MIMTSSTRKRIRHSEIEDTFVNPEFEPGPKPVAEAELQHITPSPADQGVAEEEAVFREESPAVYEEISRRLWLIDECEGKIWEMLSCINEEKNRIRNLIEGLE